MLIDITKTSAVRNFLIPDFNIFCSEYLLDFIVYKWKVTFKICIKNSFNDNEMDLIFENNLWNINFRMEKTNDTQRLINMLQY